MSDRRGLVYGVIAYGLWGIVPAFWRLVAGVDPVEVLAHRAVWGLVAFLGFVAVARRWPDLRATLRDRRTVGIMAVSGTLVAINWGVFVYAVAAHHVLDASLGYFINPLVSIALGTLVLGERLRRLQWLAIGLAASGVVILTASAGRLPWISLVLATSFGLYGLVRKTARVDALIGSTIETAILVPIAAGYLGYLAAHGGGALGHAPPDIELYLIATGVVTAGPLLLFTAAARRLPLSTVGFLQYIAPTGQFLLAVLAYDEPLVATKLAAFGLIWCGLAAFSLDLVRDR